ncbi:hypothetical protein ACIQGT_29385, partial [Streptomyces sp. NPDC093108]
GTWVQITATKHRAQSTKVYNLTVDDLHTYYVLAGGTSVLVHNTGLCDLPRPYVNPKGNWTNDLYTVRRRAMEPHMNGKTGAGKSQFLFHVEAEKVTLDAAAYADAHGLWQGNKARVYIKNGPVGVVGRSGELTNWIRVTREGRMIHSWPVGPPSGR